MMIFLEAPGSQVWIANLTSSTIVLLIIGFFFKKYISDQDIKYKEIHKKTEDVDNRSNEIENNYKTEFVAVRKEVNASNDRLQTELTREIREVTKEKTHAELKQAIDMTELKGDMKHMKQTFDQILRVLK